MLTHLGETAGASGKNQTLWIVGAIVATVLRLLLALAAFTMWIAAAAGLAEEGDSVHKTHGKLQEPAKGWCVELIFTVTFLCESC